MRIAVVGSGYVGLVAGACFADLGHDVILVDNDERKLAALKNGEVPIHEKFLPELLEPPSRPAPAIFRRSPRSRSRQHRHLRRRRHAAHRVAATPIFPTSNPSPAKSPAPSTTTKSSSKRAPSRSTPASGFATSFCATAPIRNSFDVASNPEFLREGTAVTDFLFPDRIVDRLRQRRAPPMFSAKSTRRSPAAATTSAPTRSRSPTALPFPPPIIVTSTKSAELIKHASNAFLAMKISFINAVASVCESVGANVNQVCHGIGTDSPHRPPLPQSRHRLRRFLLPQGCDGLPRRRPRVRI